MAGTIKKLAGPMKIVATTTTATDIYVPSSALIYGVIRHIHIANTDTSSRTFSLYLGLTTGVLLGTELFEDVPVAVGGYFDWYGNLKTTSTQFLTALGSVTNVMIITVMGEEYVV